MKKNNLKTRLKNGEICIGAFSNIHHESLIELSGIAGLDFIIIDAEHSAVTPQVAEQLFRAAELRDLPTVTRIGEIHPQVIQKYLDAGCQGVLMPMVNTAEEAKIVVDSVKYPPLGKRGLAGARSSDYGLFPGGLAEHADFSNKETFVAIQIETTEAIDNFDDILNVPGIDCVFFGPSDLSASLGVIGQPEHPKVLEVLEIYGKKVVEKGIAAGTITRDAAAYKKWTDIGYSWIFTGVSNLFINGVKSYLDSIKSIK